MATDYKQAIDYINSSDPVIIMGLQKARHGGFICPVCGSGDGKNGTGGLAIGKRGEKPHITCFSGGCFDGNGIQGSDIFGALKLITGGTTAEIVEKYAPNYLLSGEEKPLKTTKNHYEQGGNAPDQSDTAPAVDYSAFFRAAAQNLKAEGGSYLKGRGISLEIQNKFGVGFVDKWVHPKASPNVQARPFVIFPTSEYTYTARYSGTDETELKYKKQKVGSNAPAFGIVAAARKIFAGNSKNIVIIVEGETDCLSIWECGGIAIATGSTTGYQKAIEFAKTCKERGLDISYIISYDNETDNEKARENVEKHTNSLKKGLDELGVNSIVYYLSGAYKDVNERLQADREGLTAEIEHAADLFYKQYDIVSNAAAMGELENFIQCRSQPIKTGFPQLDKHLSGGIYSGQLIAIGAESSMGKTTFMLQMADNMAAAGTPVLFFSLEQSRFELMAKSLCREYNKRVKMDCLGNENLIEKHFKSSFDITDRNKLQYFDDYENNQLAKAKEQYSSRTAPNLYINEGRKDNGDIYDITDIERTITYFEKHLGGKKPIVIIDYLQILSADTEKIDETTKINRTVSTLKRLCREHDLSIFVISSLNRNSYNTKNVMPITEGAFKQSGTIEYSADILLAWEYAGIDDENNPINKREAEQKTPRSCRIKVLKNRNGKRGGISAFNYFAEYHFIEENTAVNEGQTEKAKSRTLIRRKEE